MPSLSKLATTAKNRTTDAAGPSGPDPRIHKTRVGRRRSPGRAIEEEAELAALHGRVQILERDLAKIRRARRRESVALRAAKRGEQIFRATWDIATLGLACLDLDGRILSVNRRFRELLGRRVSEINECDLRDWTHPDDRSKDEFVFARARLGETRFPDFDKRLVRKDGTFVWVHTHYQNLREESSGRLLCVLVEVTDRKQAEAARAEASERFRLFVESSPQAVVMADVGGCIALVNAETEAMFELSRKELLGRSVEQLVPGMTQDAHWRSEVRLLEVSTTNRTIGQIFESSGQRRDGHEFPVEVTLSPMWMGEQAFVLASIFDITERKRSERAMQYSLREKETLLKEIHHRVKNNLQMVSSLLQLQSDYIRDSDALAIFREGQNRVRSMALIHEKLYQSSSLSRIGFAGYVEGLLAILRSSFVSPTQNIEFENNIPRTEIGIDTAIPLGLIVNELISNSLKHAFPGSRSGRIKVSLTAQPDISGGLDLRVEDDGVGLPAGFEWRKAPSLGLRLVRLLSDQLGGRVEFTSGSGTFFRMLFVHPTTERLP